MTNHHLRTRNRRRGCNPSSSRYAPGATSVVLVAGLLLGITTMDMFSANAFRSAPHQRWLPLSSRKQETTVPVAPSTNHCQSNLVLFSSVGDGSGDGKGNGDGNKDDGDLGDFLDPMKKPDSADMKRARQYMNDNSLPISFDSIIGNDGADAATEESNENSDTTADANADNDETDVESKDVDLMTESSAIVSSASSRESENATSSALFGGGANSGDSEIKVPSPSLLAKNPYMQVVSNISPSDLIAKFTAESDPRVQEAVRTTILGLIGSLPKLAFETTSITTGQRLASLVCEKEKRINLYLPFSPLINGFL